MKEPKQINWEDSIGLTVTGAAYCDGSLVLAFDDGTHCVAQDWHCWEDGGMYIDDDADDVSMRALLTSGACDHEFLEHTREKERRLAEQAAELKKQKDRAWKLEQFNELKKELNL